MTVTSRIIDYNGGSVDFDYGSWWAESTGYVRPQYTGSLVRNNVLDKTGYWKSINYYY